jgi:hypothetical protein
MLQDAVNFRESFLADLHRPLPDQIQFRPSPELPRDDFLSPPPHLPPDVPAVDPQVVPVPVDSPDHDVDVRIVRVVVVDRRPDEPAPRILLELPHELPREFHQVQPVPVLG